VYLGIQEDVGSQVDVADGGFATGGEDASGDLGELDVEVAHAFHVELHELVVGERHRGDGLVVLWWCGGVVVWWCGEVVEEERSSCSGEEELEVGVGEIEVVGFIYELRLYPSSTSTPTYLQKQKKS
jgi:hypothetical protein